MTIFYGSPSGFSLAPLVLSFSCSPILGRTTPGQVGSYHAVHTMLCFDPVGPIESNYMSQATIL